MISPTHKAGTTGAMLLVVMSIATVLVGRPLSSNDWDPSVLAAFGQRAPNLTEYAEGLLGRSVAEFPDAGHDGKYFFVQANDPFLLAPDENIMVVDRPLYRAQRMMFPTLASALGILTPHLVLWSMIVVNVLAMLFGSWAVSKIASGLGGSPWWGLTFALNPGFISELLIGGGGVLAGAAAFAGVSMLQKRRYWPAAVMVVAAVLAREAMLLVALGSAGWLYRDGEKRAALRVLGLPLFALVGWAAYIRVRLGSLADPEGAYELGLPFAGLIETVGRWSTNPTHMLVRFGIVLLILLFITAGLRNRNRLLTWAFGGFTVLAVLLAEVVWSSYFDITRAVAPLLTAYLLLVFLGDRKGSTDTIHGVDAHGVDVGTIA